MFVRHGSGDWPSAEPACLRAQGVLGVYFYYDEPELGWLALCAVIGYFAAFSLGVGPVPWILASELFPPPGESSNTWFQLHSLNAPSEAGAGLEQRLVPA